MEATSVYELLALGSAILNGMWKFGIGQYRGRISVYSVILVSSTSAAMVYLLVGLVSHDLVFDSVDETRGFLGGLFNLTGTILVLKAFERGKLGVVTGVAAASTLVPLTWSILTGEHVSLLGACGIVVILAGLLAFYLPNMRLKPGEANSSTAILLAAAAALLWGVAIVVMDTSSRVSVTGTMLMSQLPQVAFTLVMVALIKRSLSGWTGRSLATLASAGVALGLCYVLFYTAANEGNIGVVSVLGSLSPIVVALMAVVFLKEQMVRSEKIAMVIVVVGTFLVVY